MYPLRQAKVRRLEAVYAELPMIDCKGLCADACGVLLMTHLEHARLSAASGSPLREDSSLDCPVLRDGRCSAYHARPLLCRLYGVTEGMPCPHGCVPDRVLSDAEARRFMDRVATLSSSPVPLCTHDLDSLRRLANAGGFSR